VRCFYSAPFFIFTVMKVCLVEFDIIWEQPFANLALLDKALESELDSDTDIIVLPEMFTTGFSMNASVLAETMDGPSLQWMKETAQVYQVAVVGSLIIEDRDNFYNRCFFVYPDGTIAFYDKQHLFTLAGEQKQYTAGTQNKVIYYKGWNIALMICYDLRFPALLRAALPFDMVIFIASWPSTRIEAWTTLLKARAIENLAYVIGVNRVGTDGAGFHYNGQSNAFDPLGKELPPINVNGITKSVKLDRAYLQKTRETLPFLEDRDSITVG